MERRPRFQDEIAQAVLGSRLRLLTLKKADMDDAAAKRQRQRKQTHGEILFLR
jgi:hypothetical protein